MVKGKKIAALLLSLTLAAGLCFTSSADDLSDAKEKQEELEKQKEAAEAEQQELSDELDSVIESMEETQQNLYDKEHEIDDAETALVEARAVEDDQYRSMKLRIKYMYEHGNSGFIDILCSANSISDLLNKAEYINKISERDRQMLVEYANTRKSIEEQEARLKVEYEELEVLRDQLQEQHDEVEEMLAEKSIQIDGLNSEISSNAERIKELIAEAEAAEARRLAALASANAYQAGGGNGQTVITGNGTLSHPIPGARITSGFGYRVAPTAGATSQHDGIDYGASTGTPIYAADDGTVITAQYNSARGYYIVVNHGNGMQTWYQHCSALYVSVGDTVTRGQNIAAVGSTGIVTGPHLHFEVHIGGTPVNPLEYL